MPSKPEARGHLSPAPACAEGIVSSSGGSHIWRAPARGFFLQYGSGHMVPHPAWWSKQRVHILADSTCLFSLKTHSPCSICAPVAPHAVLMDRSPMPSNVWPYLPTGLTPFGGLCRPVWLPIFASRPLAPRLPAWSQAVPAFSTMSRAFDKRAGRRMVEVLLRGAGFSNHLVWLGTGCRMLTHS